MRLWHEALIKELPRAQLLGQHRECCALRGKGWLKPHSTINYIFKYSRYKLFQYHRLIMHEMTQRGYQVDKLWHDASYRGKQLSKEELEPVVLTNPIYPEHNDEYLHECIVNLRKKEAVKK